MRVQEKECSFEMLATHEASTRSTEYEIEQINHVAGNDDAIRINRDIRLQNGLGKPTIYCVTMVVGMHIQHLLVFICNIVWT